MGSAALLPAVLASRPADAATRTDTDIAGYLGGLPGDVAFKIWAPATDTAPQFLAARNASQRLFVGSAIKTFALAQALTQVDAPDLVTTLQNRNLALDDTVWTQDSHVLNPPKLIGLVSERSALEAMIMHSDNTATDIIFKHLGPDAIRGFISAAGLRATQVPDSTRAFFGYLVGASDYKTFSWSQLQAAADKPIVNPPLNDTQTLASSCDDFVSYYYRALQGQFFKHPETLREFRRILALADAISVLPFPLGTSVFLKGGSIDVPGFHGLCVAGGMYFSNRWVYFSFVINWSAPAEQDPATSGLFIAAVRSTVEAVFAGLPPG